MVLISTYVASYCIVVVLVLVLIIGQQEVLSDSNVVPITGYPEGAGTPRNRQPGCLFAASFYKLEEQWHPVLHPHGEMFCILCTCLPVIKKDRLLVDGNVECNNTRDLCPKPTCGEPVVLHGECCPTCHNKQNPALQQLPSRVDQKPASLSQVPDMIGGDLAMRQLTQQPDTPYMDQGVATSTEFVSLMVGKSDVTAVKTRAVASARFTLLLDHLTYSIKVTRLQGVTSLWFQDEHGTLLYEKDVPTLQKDTICGTWSDLPSIYINYLQEKRMFIVIATEKNLNGEIGGQLINHKATAKESLSSVLSPSSRDGSGSVALMNFASDNSLTFTLLHSGIAHRKNRFGASVVFFKKKRKVKIIETTILPQANEITGTWRKPRKKDLKSLVRGRLEISIEIKGVTVMKGHVIHKQTCNVLQAILSPNEIDSDRRKMNKEETDFLTLGAGGVALFRVTAKGKLEYSVQLSGNEQSVNRIFIEPKNGRRKSKPFCTISLDETMSDIKSGSCGSVKAQTLQLLYTTKLQVKVISQPLLIGTIHPLVYHEDSFKSGIHVLLTSAGFSNITHYSSLVGHAWLSVSRLCKLHYLIALDAKHLHSDGVWTAYIQDTTTGDKILLKEISTNMLRGEVELSKDMLSSLKRRNIRLLITTTKYPGGEMASLIKIDNKCGQLFRQDSANGDDLPLIDGRRSNRPYQKRIAEETNDYCLVNQIRYRTNDIWIPVDRPCTTCNCEKGTVSCHPVVCVVPACDHPVDVEGDCCPQCLDSTFSRKKCFFDGDKRHHSIGTVFHPYVIPFGYQQCAVCSCTIEEEDVACARLPCPVLNCDQSVAIRVKPDDCCMTCPDGYDNDNELVTNPPLLRPKDIIDMRTACEVGGTVYISGSTWKPKVGSFGTMPCITCKCQNGKPTCTKQTCPELTCPKRNQITEDGTCCPFCSEKAKNAHTDPPRRR